MKGQTNQMHSLHSSINPISNLIVVIHQHFLNCKDSIYLKFPKCGPTTRFRCARYPAKKTQNNPMYMLRSCKLSGDPLLLRDGWQFPREILNPPLRHVHGNRSMYEIYNSRVFLQMNAQQDRQFFNT